MINYKVWYIICFKYVLCVIYILTLWIIYDLGLIMVLIDQFVLRNEGLSAGCTRTHRTSIHCLNTLTKRDKLKCFAICDIKVFFLPDRPHSAAGTPGALRCHRSQAVWCHCGSWAWQQIPTDARQLSGKRTLDITYVSQHSLHVYKIIATYLWYIIRLIYVNMLYVLIEFIWWLSILTDQQVF